MSAESFVDSFGRARASAIVRWHDQRIAALAMDAALRAGFSVVEFTMTTPGALELIEEYSSRQGIIVGAGTVLSVEEAERAIRSGAEFLVSPVVDEAVVQAASSHDVAIVPGACTPTEMLRAHRCGAPLVKLFPEPAGGSAWLRSLLGPLPFLRVVPTNGVDADNVVDWLEAGAFAVGFATTLFDRQSMAAEDFKGIEERGKHILDRVRAAPR